jgi:uncharacterized protein YecT (DUF1311 family)
LKKNSGQGKMTKDNPEGKPMFHKPALLMILAAAFSFHHAAAAEDCGNAITQMALNDCAAADYEAADKELNRVYAAYRKALVDEEDKKSLKAVQLAWLKYRDLSCDFETSPSKGGSIRPMNISICLAEKTRARTKELQCGEGDIACPAWVN